MNYNVKPARKKQKVLDTVLDVVINSLEVCGGDDCRI